MTSSEIRKVGFSMWNRSTSSSNAAPASGCTAMLWLGVAISDSVQRAQTVLLHPARVPGSTDGRHPSFGAAGPAQGPRSLGPGALERGEQTLERALQAEFGRILHEALVALACPQAERRLAVDRHQSPHVVQIPARLHELRSNARLDQDVARVGSLEHGVDRGELLNQGPGGLLSHAANAGQAVGGIAAKDRELRVPVGRHAVLRQDAGFVVDAELRDPAQREQ